MKVWKTGVLLLDGHSEDIPRLILCKPKPKPYVVCEWHTMGMTQWIWIWIQQVWDTMGSLSLPLPSPAHPLPCPPSPHPHIFIFIVNFICCYFYLQAVDREKSKKGKKSGKKKKKKGKKSGKKKKGKKEKDLTPDRWVSDWQPANQYQDELAIIVLFFNCHRKSHTPNTGLRHPSFNHCRI